MPPQISQLQKELTDRRTALALQVDIPDIAAYALAWNQLGADFTAAGWPHNAEICYSNAARYGSMDQCAYHRSLERLPFVSLEKCEPIPQWSDPDERILMCGFCGTYTKQVRLDTPSGEQIGWMCSCGTYTEARAYANVEELLK